MHEHQEGNQPWPVFVISLADAAERRATLRAQCAELGIEPKIVEAVDGRDGLPAELKALVDREAVRRNLGRDMTDGEIACALSHHSIYRRIVDQGLPGAIVLEDDAILTPLLPEFLGHRGYLEADLVQLDHLKARAYRKGWRGLTGRIRLAPLAARAFMATGYSISAHGAHYLLGHSMPLKGCADWPCDVMPLDPLAAVPRIVCHLPRGQDSNLEASRAALMAETRAERKKQKGGWRKFFRRAYWGRQFLKCRTKALS